jgi:outer membrane protein OmpA-like peptidoglycan-associated protein
MLRISRVSAATAMLAAVVTMVFSSSCPRADDSVVLGQSAAHKLKIVADGGAKWCAAHVALRMVLDADSPDVGNANAQIDVMNRLKSSIESACAVANNADLVVFAQDKAQGGFRASKAEGWVFKATAPAVVSLDTPAEQAASAQGKPSAAAAAAPTAESPAATAVPATQPGDFPGSHDPSFLKRYAGSKIINYLSRPYDQITLRIDSDLKKKTVEGAVTRILYRIGTGHSCLELFRNYEQSLKDAGLEITGELLPCNAEYGRLDIEGMAWSQTPMPLQIDGGNPYSYGCPTNCGPDGPVAYFSAHGVKDGQDISVGVIVVEKHHNFAYVATGMPPAKMEDGEILVGVDIVIAKAVDINMVQVKASDLADALATKGSVDLYGILFDTDKTDIKAESDKTLGEVGNLLKIDRSLKLEISGHTDNTGDKDHNQKLSEGRAQAVVDALVKKYGIDAARLQAKGYGDTKPVAPNDNDADKAKNRRVELRKL